MASKRTETLVNWDKEHIIHPFSAFGYNAGLVIKRGHGIWVQDIDGKEYIDMAAQMGFCLLGHRRKEIIEAVRQQMEKIEANHLCFGLSNTKTIEYAQRLAEVTPEGLDHFWFCSGGTEATDTAFKIAHLYWHFQEKHRWKIIGLYGGYHGAGTSLWSSSTAKGAFWEGVGPPVPGFTLIPSYDCDRCMFELKYPDCNVRCARHLAKAIESEGVGNVAAFIAEPVMGSGGQIAPPPEYWPTVRKICDEYDILLIADEVQSGFTKTGKMFALQHWSITPDMMVLAKGISSGYIPFGAVAVSNRIFQALKGHPFWHAFTYSGHPVACAAALAALNIYVRDNLSENAAKVGNHIMERLEAEFKSLPCVGGFSGLGLMIGVDIVADKATKAPLTPGVRENIQREIWRRGVLTRPIAGHGDIRLFVCPPVVITEEEADKMLDIILPIIAAIKPN